MQLLFHNLVVRHTEVNVKRPSSNGIPPPEIPPQPDDCLYRPRILCNDSEQHKRLLAIIAPEHHAETKFYHEQNTIVMIMDVLKTNVYNS